MLWTLDVSPMKALSLGQIGKLSGYSRTRTHQLAVDGRIPFHPIKQPPQGQYRYEDTPELRAWCQEKRNLKPKRKDRSPSRPPRGGKINALIEEFIEALESGTASREDLTCAKDILDACECLIDRCPSHVLGVCSRLCALFSFGPKTPYSRMRTLRNFCHF